MGLQNVAGQSEPKAQKKTQPQAPTYGALWAQERAFASLWSATRCKSMRSASELVLRPEFSKTAGVLLGYRWIGLEFHTRHAPQVPSSVAVVR